MSITITIKQKDLLAVSYAMAVKGIRYYLNSVCIETNGAETRIVATDGHRIHAVHHDTDGLIEREPKEYILPDTFVKNCLKAKGSRKTDPALVFTFDDDRVSARLPDGTEAIAKLVEGKFPDWRMVCVIDPGAPQEAASYNYAYLIDLYKGVKAYTGATDPYNVPFIQRGTSGGYLQVGAFFGLVMPRRANAAQALDNTYISALRKPPAD